MPRIVLLGISGAGKSTLAQLLSADLGVPHIELDALHHTANWAPNPRFVEAVVEVVDASPSGWVVDGNYLDKLGDTVLSRADTVVWVDPPRYVSTLRAVRRTVRRFVTRAELWNGNRESLRDIFKSYHPIWWSWTQAAATRRPIHEALERFPDLTVSRVQTNADARHAMESIRSTQLDGT